MIEFTLNGGPARSADDPPAPVIAAVRNELNLTGTKALHRRPHATD